VTRGRDAAAREAVLVWMPDPEDMAVVSEAIEQAELLARYCSNLEQLHEDMADASAVLVAEEAIDVATCERIAADLDRQPAWSDLPLLLVSEEDDATAKTRSLVRMLDPVGNVTMLGRPFRHATLYSALRVAKRARRRQHEMRHLYEELEDRVRERTDALQLLSDIATVANRSDSIVQALHYCLERVCRFNGWCFGHAYFRSADDPETLLPLASHYAADAARFAQFRERTFRTSLQRGEGLPGRVFETGRTESTTDVKSELAGRRADTAGMKDVRTALAFPVKVGDAVLGVLEFFSDEEVEVEASVAESLATVGAQLGRIIERHDSRRALEEGAARLRQIAEQIRDAVWLQELAPDRVTYCSPQYESIWGWHAGRLNTDSRDWIHAVHAKDRARVQRAYESVLGGEPADEMFRSVRSDGTERWIRWRGDPVFDERDATYRIAHIAEDVTRARELEARAARIAERERERIGRDLHDTVGQELVGIALAAERAGRKLAEAGRAESGTVQELAKGVRAALGGVRAAARGLAPMAESAEHLVLALEELAASVRSRHGIDCEFRCPDDVSLPEEETPTQLYRIASEAVANAARHGRPQRIAIRLAGDGDAFELAIEDDGCGLPDEIGNGLGLWTMQERAASIGARLEIGPRPGGGTVVRCGPPG